MRQVISKDDKAVSPIIATILLIAITVVLAATLVTILGGFTKGASSSAATASVSTQYSSTGSAKGFNTSTFLNVSSFSANNVSSSKIAISLTITNSTGTYTYTGNLGGKTLSSSTSNAVSTANIVNTAYFTGGSDYEITVTGWTASGTNGVITTSVTVQLTYSGTVIYSSGTVT